MNKKVLKRIRPRNVHIFIEQPSTLFTPRIGEKRLFNSLGELVGLVSAGAGIFVALLYVAGRSFASGYFSAMNIPDYQVSFSVWEYGAVAWFPLFIYPPAIIVLCRLLWNWLSKKIGLKLIKGFDLALVLLILLVIFTLQFVEQWGEGTGRFNVLENAAQVELVSATPMLLDGVSVVTEKVGVQQYQHYVYKGFHLLTFNGGKYYLFKEIDPATCKPLQVFIINDDKSVQVNLLPAVSINDQCQGFG